MATEPPPPPPGLVALQRQLVTIGLPALAALIIFLACAAYFSDLARLDVQRRILDAEAQVMRHSRTAQLMVAQASSAIAALAAVVPLATKAADLDLAAEMFLNTPTSPSWLEVRQGDTHRQWTLHENGIAVDARGELQAHAISRPTAIGRSAARVESGQIILETLLYLNSPGDSLIRWGHIRAVIGLDRLMRNLALGDLLRSGYPVQLIVVRPDRSIAAQLAGSTGAMPGAREQVVVLPDGGSLIVRVGPRGGTAPHPLLYAQIALSAVAALLFAVFAHIVLRRLLRPATVTQPLEPTGFPAGQLPHTNDCPAKKSDNAETGGGLIGA